MSYALSVDQTCPACGTMNDACTGITAATPPKVEDISLCAYCGQVSVFYGAPLRLRRMRGSEFAALNASTQSQIALARDVIRRAGLKSA